VKKPPPRWPLMPGSGKVFVPGAMARSLSLVKLQMPIWLELR
jgi:hypothetical protein